VTIVFTAKLVWREGDTNIDNATLRANTLVDENIPKILDIRIIVRVGLGHQAVNHAELPLGALVLVLLGSKPQAGIEPLCVLVIRRVHLNDIFEDKLCLGRIRHEGGGCDTLDIWIGTRLGEVAHFSWMVSGQGRGLAAWKVGVIIFRWNGTSIFS
jgi:hypothetical protein